MIQVLALEGPDGTGKSTHADTLAAALRERGVDAVAFHHTKPADADPVLAALDYAAQRRRLMLAPPARVIVADRWWHSTEVAGRVLGSMPLRTLYEWEVRVWRETLRGEVRKAQANLTAPWGHLEARLMQRGRESTPREREERAAYEALAEYRSTAPLIDTSRPRDDVAAELLAWALGVLS